MGAVPARFPALVLLACFLAFIGAGTGTTAKVPVVSASAYAVQVNIPGQPGVGAGGSAAPSEVTTAAADTFAHPADASAVKTGGLSSSAFAEGTTAQGVSDVLEVSLFNGEITADSVAARAKASSSAADAVGSAVTNLVLLGQGVTPVPNQRFPLGDWGYAITLELTAEAPVADDTRNARAAVTALRVVLLADHGGLPVGTDILIGHAEASSSTPLSILAPPPVKQAKPAKPGRPAGVPPKKKKKPLPKPPEPDTSQPGSVFKLPPTDVSAPLSPDGYVFPVYGPSSFTDTFGSPRAGVGWHHGEDIFAPLGAPLLAVADGTVFSVGWNELGGYRLWLRDHQGNQFYYAHLSAFSPLAVDGREVRAGAVIGFVGNTGGRAEHALPSALRDSPRRPAADGLRRRRRILPVSQRLAAARGRFVRRRPRLGPAGAVERDSAETGSAAPRVDRHLERERAQARFARTGARRSGLSRRRRRPNPIRLDLAYAAGSDGGGVYE